MTILLKILSGEAADREVLVRRFPFVVGRSAKADCRLDGAGVWAEHCRLDSEPGKGITVSPVGDAIVRVNGQPVGEAHLRVGDTISIGDGRLRFWLGPVSQGSLAIREGLTWISLGILIVTEIFLAFGLPG